MAKANKNIKVADLPFEKGSPRYKAAQALLKASPTNPVAYADLIEAAGGTLSTRTLGGIIVGLENSGARFKRYRHADWGITYERDDSQPKIGNHSGPDVTKEYAHKGVKRGTKNGTKPAKKVAKEAAKKAVAKRSGASTPASKGKKVRSAVRRRKVAA
jgi:hypothetical protein